MWRGARRRREHALDDVGMLEFPEDGDFTQCGRRHAILLLLEPHLLECDHLASLNMPCFVHDAERALAKLLEFLVVIVRALRARRRHGRRRHCRASCGCLQSSDAFSTYCSPAPSPRASILARESIWRRIEHHSGRTITLFSGGTSLRVIPHFPVSRSVAFSIVVAGPLSVGRTGGPLSV